MKTAFLPVVGQQKYGKNIKLISNKLTNQLELPLTKRFQKMRKVTDKIEFKDNKHPFDMMKSYYKKKVAPTMKKLIAAAAAPNAPDGNDINKNLKNFSIVKKYKNLIKNFQNNKIYQSNLKK